MSFTTLLCLFPHPFGRSSLSILKDFYSVKTYVKLSRDRQEVQFFFPRCKIRLPFLPY